MSIHTEIIGNATLHLGDCMDILPMLDACSADSIVADPPYGLSFMGKDWDRGIPGAHFWMEAMRVAKPGAFLLAFGGTRTFHRLACAIEDAGWELRDTIMWVYGSGFPKSHNGEWGGTALKPAWEPIIVARKPFKGTVEANWREHGTGGLNIDGCRIELNGDYKCGANGRPSQTGLGDNYDPTKANQHANVGRWPANLVHDGSEEVLAAFPDAVGQIADASSSSRKTQNVYGDMKRGNGRDGEDSANNDNTGSVGFKMKQGARRGDSGSAARFFYCAKASRADRNDGCEGLQEKIFGMSNAAAIAAAKGEHYASAQGGTPSIATRTRPSSRLN